MAISKKTVSNNKPEALPEIPHPCPPHHDDMPELTLYESFDEAVRAVNWVHLMPGETHTEFYKEDDLIHCVVGIGNINKGKQHLILSDSGDSKSLSDQFAEVVSLINKANASISKIDCKYNAAIEEINTNLEAAEEDIADLQAGLNNLKSTVSSLTGSIEKITTLLAALATKVNNSATKDDLKTITNNLTTLSSNINNVSNNLVKTNANVTTLTNTVTTLQSDVEETKKSVSGYDVKIAELETQVKANTNDIALDHKEIDDLLDQVLDLDKRIDNQDASLADMNMYIHTVEDKVKDLSNNIDLVSSNVKANAEDISIIKAELIVQNTSINSIDADVDKIYNKINDINSELDEIEAAQANQDASLEDHEGRIKFLEGVAGKTEIDALKKDIADVSSRVAVNEEAQENLESYVKDLSSNVSIINTTLIEKIELGDSSLKSYVDTVKENLSESIEELSSDVNERIDILESSVNEHFDEVDASIKDILDKYEAVVEELGYVKSDLADVSALAIENAGRIADVSEYAEEVSTRLDEHIIESEAKFNEVDSSISNVKETINDLSTRANASHQYLKNYIREVNASVNLVADKLADVSNVLDEHIVESEAKFVEVDSSIAELKANDELLAEKIVDISSNLDKHLAEAANKFAEVDASIVELKTTDKVLQAEIEEAYEEISNIDSSIVEIKENIQVIDNSINSIEEEQLELNARIADVSEYVEEVSTRLDEHIAEATNKFAEVDASIEELKAKDEQIDSSIELLNEYIDLVDASLAETTEKLDQHIIDSSVKFAQVDASLEELEEHVNSLDVSIITDASINHLFSEDILTVNLCCVTDGGHVEVYDNYSEDVDPYYRADGYKTYVEGDRIVLKAVANEGYRFDSWLLGKNSSIDDFSSNASIGLIFADDPSGWSEMGWCGNHDINVIGTLNPGKGNYDYDERPPLMDGYTALFAKLCKIKYAINVTNDYADYRDVDNASITTDNTGDYIDPHYDNQYVYVDLKSNAIVTPIAATDKHHTFEYFSLVDGSTEIIYDSPYIFPSVVKDHTLQLNFKEERYHILAEAKDYKTSYITITWYKDEECTEPYTAVDFECIADTYVKIVAKDERPDDHKHFSCWQFSDVATDEHYHEGERHGQPISSIVEDPTVSTIVIKMTKDVVNPEGNNKAEGWEDILSILAIYTDEE